jgi:hypothetical protein
MALCEMFLGFLSLLLSVRSLRRQNETVSRSSLFMTVARHRRHHGVSFRKMLGLGIRDLLDLGVLDGF